MADLYDTLSPSDQTNVRNALFAFLGSGASQCTTVDVSGITGPNNLTDASTRAAAIDCFQTVRGVGQSGVGVLDQATYTALVGWWAALPMWQKIALVGGGLAAVGGIAWLLTHQKKRKRLTA